MEPWPEPLPDAYEACPEEELPFAFRYSLARPKQVRHIGSRGESGVRRMDGTEFGLKVNGTWQNTHGATMIA